MFRRSVALALVASASAFTTGAFAPALRPAQVLASRAGDQRARPRPHPHCDSPRGRAGPTAPAAARLMMQVPAATAGRSAAARCVQMQSPRS
jgi:hypothetical protein